MGFMSKGKQEDEKSKEEKLKINGDEFVYDPISDQIGVAIVRVKSKLAGDQKSKFRTFLKFQVFESGVEVKASTDVKSEIVLMELKDFNDESIEKDKSEIVTLHESYLVQCKEINEFLKNDEVSEEAKRKILSQRLSSIFRLEDSDSARAQVKLELTKDAQQLIEVVKNPSFKKGEINVDEKGMPIFPIDLKSKTIHIKKRLITEPGTFDIVEKSTIEKSPFEQWKSEVEEFPTVGIRPVNSGYIVKKSNKEYPSEGVPSI